jgi:hypothetical protein
MNPSYFRLRQNKPVALARFATACGVADIGPLVATSSSQAIDLVTTPAGTWRSPAVFIFEKDDWTVFDDLTGTFSARPADFWLPFAG